MSQPILVLIDKEAENPFSSYILEILDTEGIFTYDVKDLSQAVVRESGLIDYDLVILANIDPGKEVKESLQRYVREGGNLIGLRPPLDLNALFGLEASGDWMGQKMIFKERYIKINKTHPLVSGIAAEVLQFHGEADVYREKGARVLAYFYNEFDLPTNNYPAIATFKHGKGRTAVFTFDLAKSTVLFHQGRYDQSSIGSNPDLDGDGMFKPNDLFVNYLDIRLRDVPQADVYQDILVRLINWLSAFKKPLPRIWHFPHAQPAVALISGDSDNMNKQDVERTFSAVEKYQAKYTLYLMEQDYEIVSPELEKHLRHKGHSFGQHVWAGPKPTLLTMEKQIKSELQHFQRRYGYVPLTNRGHSIIWVGWTEMAEYLAENGIKIDSNFYCGRYIQYGYSSGSGLPTKFMNKKGELIDLYEQPTLFSDDSLLEDKTFLPPHTVKEAAEVTKRVIDDCIDKYNTVFHACFHPIRTRPGELGTLPWLNEVLAHCSERNITFVSGDEWLRFNDARRAIEFRNLEYGPKRGVLAFDFKGSISVKGITLMLPAKHLDKAIGSVAVDNEAVEHSLTTLGGTPYALFVMDIKHAEWRRIEAKYTIESSRL